MIHDQDGERSEQPLPLHHDEIREVTPYELALTEQVKALLKENKLLLKRCERLSTLLDKAQDGWHNALEKWFRTMQDD